MSEVNIDAVEKNTDSILQIVGKQSYVNWEEFTQNSSEVARHIDALSQALGVFRELQHKNFIQTMKKLKNYDLPDLLQAVKNKKLPKQALRGVLGRFKFNGDKLELNQSVETLKGNAKADYEAYSQKNNEVCAQLEKFTEFLNKRIEETGFVPEKVPEMQKMKSTVQFNLSEDSVTKLASGIDIQYLPGTKKLIGLKTYTQLLDANFTLIKDQYKNLTIKSRKDQRTKMNDHPEYLKCLNEFLNNAEALINEGQAALAKKIGITEEKLGESEMAMMERNLGNNLIMLQSQLRGKIKQSVKSEKDVSVDVAKEVIRYQVDMIEKKTPEINSILKGLDQGPQVVQMVPMLLALILNDYVYEKYGYEEEDFMKNLGEQILSNKEFIQIFKDMESGILKLMQKLDIIPPEVAEMMKQQQEYMEKMGGMMPPGMMPGMMPPGMMPPGAGMMPQGMGLPGMSPPGVNQNSNPLEMLQNQQLQQMQQMFQNMQPPK